MSKNNRLSHDQKRKAKLKKREARSLGNVSLAYSGKKYKTDEFAPVFYRTELGIYESHVMCDRGLTDTVVARAVESLVLKLREGPLPDVSKSDPVTVTKGHEDELVIANIRRNWQDLAVRGTLPVRDDLVGVLRTILNSISVWRSKSLHSQGYLQYIEGFMKKLGVSVRSIVTERVTHPELESGTPSSHSLPMPTEIP